MTSEEIVKALRVCVMDPDDGGDCEKCPASRPEGEYCLTAVMSQAADLIEQLTDENTELREEVNLRGNAVRTYEKKRAQAEAERDALLEYAKILTGCDTCKRRNYCKSDSACDECEQDVKGNCYCKDCERGSKWEWQGLTEVPEEGDT